MKKYLLLTIVLLIIAAIGTAGFFFAFSPKKNNVVPSPSDTAKPALLNLASFRGVLAEAINNLDSEISKVSSPSGTSQTSPQTSGNGSTETASAPNAFSFAVIGDTKVFSANNPNGNLEKAVKSIEKQNPNFAFIMGDIVSSCDGGSKCEGKYNDWKSVMGSLLSKTYEVVGNHDRTGGSGADAVWQKEFNLPTNGPAGFSELTYSFDYGNSHFVVLNSEKPKEHIVNDVQRAWLERDLAANKKENTFVFFHEFAYQVSQNSKDGLDAETGERDALWNILKKHNVKYVFNGHAHLFSEKKIGNIYQIVEGDTDSTDDDFPLAGFADYAYKGKAFSVVQVDGGKVNLKLYSVDGNLIKSLDFS